MKAHFQTPSETLAPSQEAAARNEKPVWLPPKLVRLDIDETEGALAGNADPFFS